MESKQSQREYLMTIRRQIPGSIRELKSEAIAERFFALKEYAAAKTIMVYMSYGSEVDTQRIFTRLTADKKRVAVPRCADNYVMDGYFVTKLTDMKSGSYGIPEPKPELIACKTVTPADKNEIDLIIVPGLGFDKDGYRIGYGKGYYDRYLDGYAGCTVGLCFSECILSRVAFNEYDRKIDMVLTENAVYGE